MSREAERSVRLELGLKEPVEAGGTGGSHPRDPLGLERSLDLFQVQRNLHLENPVPSPLCSPCLAHSQRLHGGTQGSPVLLMGKAGLWSS